MDDLSNEIRGVLSTDKNIFETGGYKYYNMLLSEMGIRKTEAIKYYRTYIKSWW